MINVYTSSGEVLTDLTATYSQVSGSTFILRDFNLHHSLWGASYCFRHSEKFVEWIFKEDLCIINTLDPTNLAPTSSTSLLDLLISSSDLLACTVHNAEEDSWGSDNFFISITMDVCDSEMAVHEYFKWTNIIREVNENRLPLKSITYDS